MEISKLFIFILAISITSCHKVDNNSVTARNVVEREFDNLLAIPTEMDATKASFVAKSGTTI